MAKLIRCILTVGGNFKMPRDNKEAKTRNPVLRKVQENTEDLADYFRSNGIKVSYEMNPGNHFRGPALRSAKGIKAIL